MLEQLGYQIGDCESRDPWSGKTYDLFAIVDLLAFDPVRKQTVAVQVTDGDSGGHVSKRVKKCLESPMLPICLAGGWQFEVWGVRDVEVRDGSPVSARYFEINEDGTRVVAFEGSQVLSL